LYRVCDWHDFYGWHYSVVWLYVVIVALFALFANHSLVDGADLECRSCDAARRHRRCHGDAALGLNKASVNEACVVFSLSNQLRFSTLQ
jgi:hypothetical protein